MMNQELVPNHRQEPLRGERMLFVRTEGILPTMAKVPYLVAGLIIVAIAIPIQNSFSSTRSLDLIIYPDGSTHVFSEFDVDPLEPDFEVNLFGSTIDNFVAVGENGFLLSSDIIGDIAKVETFGSSTVSIDYDIHDLVSKEARIWTFALNSPSDYTLLMPQNSVIVGMTNYPLSMETTNEQSKLYLPSGTTEIDYIFSTPITSNPTPTPPNSANDESPNYSMVAIGGAIAAASIISAIMIKRNQKKSSTVQTVKAETSKSIPNESIDLETISKLRPDIREDDKEIISFLIENGGQALESELRKKFLQPRTTMWRAVKRLERHGIIEIQKKDLQNLVKLKKKLEEEE